MKDMFGENLSVGDFFMIPGGNVRYGGLVLEVGVVLSMTEKRVKTLITRFDKVKLKPTSKTPTKLYKINLTDSLKATEAIIALKKALESQK